MSAAEAATNTQFARALEDAAETSPKAAIRTRASIVTPAPLHPRLASVRAASCEPAASVRRPYSATAAHALQAAPADAASALRRSQGRSGTPATPRAIAAFAGLQGQPRTRKVSAAQTSLNGSRAQFGACEGVYVKWPSSAEIAEANQPPAGMLSLPASPRCALLGAGTSERILVPPALSSWRAAATEVFASLAPHSPAAGAKAATAYSSTEDHSPSALARSPPTRAAHEANGADSGAQRWLRPLRGEGEHGARPQVPLLRICSKAGARTSSGVARGALEVRAARSAAPSSDMKLSDIHSTLMDQPVPSALDRGSQQGVNISDAAALGQAQLSEHREGRPSSACSAAVSAASEPPIAAAENSALRRSRSAMSALCDGGGGATAVAPVARSDVPSAPHIACPYDAITSLPLQDITDARLRAVLLDWSTRLAQRGDGQAGHSRGSGEISAGPSGLMLVQRPAEQRALEPRQLWLDSLGLQSCCRIEVCLKTPTCVRYNVTAA